MAHAIYRYGVDWDNDGFICWSARPGDGLNLIASPLRWSGIATLELNGATLALTPLVTDYGTQALRVTSGTHVNGGVAFGHGSTGGASTIPVAAATAHGTAVWLRGVSDFSGIDVVVLVIDQAYNLLAATTLTLTGDWQRVALTFTTGAGSTHLYWHMQKVSSATAAVWDATGFMLVAGSAAPAGFNVGDATNLYDDLSDTVQAARWRLGFSAAGQRVADDVEAEITLVNADRRYSPDDASGPLYGAILPQRRVVIESAYAGTTRRHFTGFLDSVRPAPGRPNGTHLATLRAGGIVAHLKATEISLPLMRDTTAEAVIEAVITRTVMPPAALGGAVWTWDVPGRCTWDTGVMRFSDPATTLALDAGRNAYPFVGDTWDKAASAWQALVTVAEAERGKIFIDRDGRLVFKNRTWLQMKTDVDAVIDNAHGLDYRLAADDIVNAVQVGLYPRVIGASASDVLWTLNEPFTLNPRTERELRVRWAAADRERVAAIDVTAPNSGDGTLVSDPAGVIVTGYEIEARGARITIRNTGGQPRTVTNVEFRGRKITSANQVTVAARDALSIGAYGLREQTLDLKLLADTTFAQAVAQYEVAQRKDARGRAAGVTLLDKDGTYLTHCLARSLGDRVTLSEDQTAHAADYFIVGEAHEVMDAGRLHRATFTLEPVPLAPCWIWDEPGRSAFDTATATFAL